MESVPWAAYHSRYWVVVQFEKVARASRPWNHAQDARATSNLHDYPILTSFAARQ